MIESTNPADPKIMSATLTKILVWDIPARLLHWAFAASLGAALAIGLLVEKEHALFQLHMLLGIIAIFLLAVRLVLGLVGSRYSLMLTRLRREHFLMRAVHRQEHRSATRRVCRK